MGTATARIACDENVKRLQYCFMFGVERAFWNDAKSDGLSANFNPIKHSVRASGLVFSFSFFFVLCSHGCSLKRSLLAIGPSLM